MYIYTHSILFTHIYHMYKIYAFTSTFLHLSIKPWVHITTSNSNPIPQSYYSFFFPIPYLEQWKTWRPLSSIYLLIESVLPVCNQLPALPPHSHKEVLLTLFRLWHIAGPSLLPQAPLILLGFNIPCQVTTTLLHRLPPHPNQALTRGARPASTLLTPTEVASIYQLCLSI